MNHLADITIQHAIRQATQRLDEAGIETARLDAEVLLRHVLQIDRTQLFLRYPDLLGPTDKAAFDALISQRTQRSPVAYLTGTREFMGLPFQTTPAVLIPRPDTEPLVEWALAWLRDYPRATVADIGTGSGAIAVSIAAHTDKAFAGSIIATDTSAESLEIATRNARRLLPANRMAHMDFRVGSLTEPIRERVDLLVTNLPYLTPEQIADNPELDQEPILALDGGQDGLDLINRVIDDLPRVLSKDGAAGFEIDPSQETPVANRLQATFPGGRVSIVRDLAQFSRHVVVERPATGR